MAAAHNEREEDACLPQAGSSFVYFVLASLRSPATSMLPACRQAGATFMTGESNDFFLRDVRRHARRP